MPANPNGRTNADVLKPWVNGMDLTRRPAGKWIVDFGWTMSEGDAALYEEPFGGSRITSTMRHGHAARTAKQIVASTGGDTLGRTAEHVGKRSTACTALHRNADA